MDRMDCIPGGWARSSSIRRPVQEKAEASRIVLKATTFAS